jgi:hypothetical protein
MKKLLLAALLLSAVSCAHDEDKLEYQKVRTYVSTPDVQNEPEGPNIQYMAYSLAEERALSGWLDSRSEASSKAREYASEHPDRQTTILWRQKPGTNKERPKYPRG